MSSRSVLRLAGGDFEIRSLGALAEYIRREIHSQKSAFDTDELHLDCIERGDYLDESLAFRKVRVKLKPVYDKEVYGINDAKFKNMAEVHFIAHALLKLLSKAKTTALEGDCHLDDLSDASIEWAKQGGTNGFAILVDKSIVFVNPDTFVAHFVDVKRTRTHRVEGAVF